MGDGCIEAVLEQQELVDLVRLGLHLSLDEASSGCPCSLFGGLVSRIPNHRIVLDPCSSACTPSIFYIINGLRYYCRTHPTTLELALEAARQDKW